MAVTKINIIDVELMGGQIHRSFMNRMIGEGDVTGDRFGVRLWQNGAAVSLVGASCVGFFIRPDDVTLVLNGGTVSNIAYVNLPQAAYVKEGKYTLTIKVSGTGFTGTVCIIDGSVVSTTTGTINDPSDSFPGTDAYASDVAAAEAAAAVINGLSIDEVQITGTRYKIAVTQSE